jgi:hypothetical protein
MRRISTKDVDKPRTGSVTLFGRRFFCKYLTSQELDRELSGYDAVRPYYPVANLVCSGLMADGHGIMLFEYVDSINTNKGLLVDAFAKSEVLDEDFIRVLKMYALAFSSTIRLDYGASSKVFFDDRVHGRLDSYYSKNFVNYVDGKQFVLNGRRVTINLGRVLARLADFFSEKKKRWCVVSQCDPNDLNIGTDPILLDYTAGGWNPLMAEFATFYWYNLAQGNYLSLRYNRTAFNKHRLIFHKTDFVKLERSCIQHSILMLRKSFIEAYIKRVVLPCFEQIDSYQSWYEDFRHYLAMKILGVFNVATMTVKDRWLSLAYLSLFYDDLFFDSPLELSSFTLEL